MALSVGDKAPEFVLIGTDRKPKRLSDFLGKKIVLAFYPAAFTSVCTKEVCTFRDQMETLKLLDTQVIGISVDSPFSNKAFAEQYQVNFPLLSDFTRYVSAQYTGLYLDLGGVPGYTAAKRSIFVLDREGVVRYAWIADTPGLEPNYEEVREILQRL